MRVRVERLGGRRIYPYEGGYTMTSTVRVTALGSDHER